MVTNGSSSSVTLPASRPCSTSMIFVFPKPNSTMSPRCEIHRRTCAGDMASALGGCGRVRVDRKQDLRSRSVRTRDGPGQRNLAFLSCLSQPCEGHDRRGYQWDSGRRRTRRARASPRWPRAPSDPRGTRTAGCPGGDRADARFLGAPTAAGRKPLPQPMYVVLKAARAPRRSPGGSARRRCTRSARRVRARRCRGVGGRRGSATRWSRRQRPRPRGRRPRHSDLSSRRSSSCERRRRWPHREGGRGGFRARIAGRSC